MAPLKGQILMMEDFIMKPVYPAARALPTYENLLLEMVEPNILKVTLNRPKAYNALSHDLVRELTELSQWLVDEYYNIRVVLLYGGDEGKGFCAGPVSYTHLPPPGAGHHRHPPVLPCHSRRPPQ